jgi:hypothetical protein
MKIFKTNLNFQKQNWTFRPQRIKIWGDFVKGYTSGKILVCGMGEIEKLIAPKAELVGTEGDYNWSLWKPSDLGLFKTAYCFETVEHLCNPLLFLVQLRLFLEEDADVFISWPSGRPQFLWTNGHFHEMRQDRAEELFKMAGYRIVHHKWTPILWKKPWEYFKGIRPFLRLIFPLRCLMYHLKPM